MHAWFRVGCAARLHVAVASSTRFTGRQCYRWIDLSTVIVQVAHDVQAKIQVVQGIRIPCTDVCKVQKDHVLHAPLASLALSACAATQDRVKKDCVMKTVCANIPGSDPQRCSRVPKCSGHGRNLTEG